MTPRQEIIKAVARIIAKRGDVTDLSMNEIVEGYALERLDGLYMRPDVASFYLAQTDRQYDRMVVEIWREVKNRAINRNLSNTITSNYICKRIRNASDQRQGYIYGPFPYEYFQNFDLEFLFMGFKISNQKKADAIETIRQTANQHNSGCWVELFVGQYSRKISKIIVYTYTGEYVKTFWTY